MKIPKEIFSGWQRGGHVQGIAIDKEKGHVYFSFTTRLIKTDLEGNVLGSVKDLAGHLGCITFCPEDGNIYGSLEYKHDIIGRGIVNNTGVEFSQEDAFYLVRFETALITEEEMEAEKVMKGIFLREVTEDYKATDEASGREHRYGCSGIDGTAFGPVFGCGKDSTRKLMVSYGIYRDAERDDNDYQVILQYDIKDFDRYAKAIDIMKLHYSGPENCEARYFLYTGNTTYGIQNLEYDESTGDYFAAVYVGVKPQFENPPMFIIDGSAASEYKELTGRGGEKGLVLRLKGTSDFPYGQTGFAAMGDGLYCISINSERHEEKKYSSLIKSYSFDGKTFNEYQ